MRAGFFSGCGLASAALSLALSTSAGASDPYGFASIAYEFGQIYTTLKVPASQVDGKFAGSEEFEFNSTQMHLVAAHISGEFDAVYASLGVKGMVLSKGSGEVEVDYSASPLFGYDLSKYKDAVAKKDNVSLKYETHDLGAFIAAEAKIGYMPFSQDIAGFGLGVYLGGVFDHFALNKISLEGESDPDTYLDYKKTGFGAVLGVSVISDFLLEDGSGAAVNADAYAGYVYDTITLKNTIKSTTNDAKYHANEFVLGASVGVSYYLGNGVGAVFAATYDYAKSFGDLKAKDLLYIKDNSKIVSESKDSDIDGSMKSIRWGARVGISYRF